MGETQRLGQRSPNAKSNIFGKTAAILLVSALRLKFALTSSSHCHFDFKVFQCIGTACIFVKHERITYAKIHSIPTGQRWRPKKTRSERGRSSFAACVRLRRIPTVLWCVSADRKPAHASVFERWGLWDYEKCALIIVSDGRRISNFSVLNKFGRKICNVRRVRSKNNF